MFHNYPTLAQTFLIMYTQHVLQFDKLNSIINGISEYFREKMMNLHGLESCTCFYDDRIKLEQKPLQFYASPKHSKWQ